METFDYSQVPFGFVVCASADCPEAPTCLRHIALKHAPAKYAYLPTLTPARLETMKDNCQYYCPDKKVRYAKGFTRAIDRLTVSAFRAFKSQLIGYCGYKNYYRFRKGDKLIKPADQKYIIRVARELGLQLDDYFDDYVEGYAWKD